MWISIQSKRIDLSPRMRRNIEAHIQRALQREKGEIASAIVSVGPAKFQGELLAMTCRIRLWSSDLGLVTVSDAGDTIRTAVQQATLRARHAARRQLKKLRSQRRRLSRSRLERWLPGIAAE